MENDALSSEDYYSAYITAEPVDSPRVPILGERIIIELGDDDDGRPMELSIVLRKPKDHSGKIAMYSIVEPLSNVVAGQRPRQLTIEQCAAVNMIRISLECKPRL